MAQFEKHFVQDLTQDIKIRQCGTIVFNGDNLSNVITVDLYNGTEPYSGGGSVSCSVICPDGATVPITNGSISGSTVTVTLTGDCFALPGQIGVGVQVVSGDIRTTILKAIYNVELLETDTIVDPGSRITASVGQLVSDIENAVAQIPASDMASLMAGIAPTFSAFTNYTAGAYVYYNGTLYRFTANHAAGSWTGTDATQVALSNDLGSKVSDLKSAIIGLDGKTIDFKYPYFIGFNSPYKWGVSNGVYSYIIPVNGGDFVQFKSAATAARYAFLKSLTGATTSDTPDYATGYTQSVAVSANTSTAVTAPSDAKYLYMIAYDGSNSRAPVSLSINGYDLFNSIIGNTSRDISVYRLNITSGTYAANLSDLNNAQVNTVYNLVFDPGTTTLPSHYPLDAYRGTVNTLLTLARHNGIGPIKAQYLFAEDVIYSRYADGSDNYTSWVLLYGSLPEWTPKAETTLITASNYATKLSDCDNATLFKLYAINFAIGSTSIPANTPYGSSWAGELPLLFTYGAGNVKGQIWIDRKTVYTRYGANGTWYAWKIVGNNINENRVYTVDPNGAGDYTSFVECVKEAVKYKNSTVYVNQGDYDLVSEWGSSYLDDNDDDLGLMLGNGIHIIFSSNAKLTFNYTGSNTYILTEFAPFNADWQGSYLDYTLENMTLECSNCRYGIHDELHGTATRATHKYLNCHIDFDNTNNAEWSGDCIGGGLGSNAEIIVRNCVFKCLNNWENSPAFSWHNAKVPVAQNAKSRIVIDGCYCVGTAGSKKGTFRFGYYGYSQKITEIIICNNSFTLEPFFINETEDDSPYENAEFIKWNNEIRSN